MHHDSYIAGVKFRPGAQEHLDRLTDGVELSLEAEPTNRYDPNAVKVLHDGVHLGYVPRELAESVGKSLAGGHIEKVIRTRGKIIQIHFRPHQPGQESMGV